MLNLGDAPYLDEIFGDESQQQLAQMSISTTDSGAPQVPDPAKNACSGYQLLLHLYGVVPEAVTVLSVSTTNKVLPKESLVVAFAPPDRIDRPPRSISLSI